MRKTLLIILLLFAKNSDAQVPPVLDSIFDHTIDSVHNLLGYQSLSAAAQLPDSSVWAGAAGVSSVIPPANVTTSDAYLIGSVTKTMTAACILQLAEQNVLNLDDSLYMWLDTIQYINPAITIRQLLRHESGLYDVLTAPGNQTAMINDPDSIWAAHDIITTFIGPPVFTAGTSWSYSNTNYLLLGMIIEAATGNPFYEEIRNRFLIPLGLNTIVAWPYEQLTSPVAHLWLDLNNDGITDDAHNWFMANEALNASGGAAGCYFATPTDLTKWMRSYMRGDLIASSIMSQAYVTVPSPGLPGASYGLGLMDKYFLSFYQGLGHGGDFGYAASSWYFPLRDISITVTTNDSQHNSWSLVPAVSALLKAYNQWLTATSVSEVNTSSQISVFPNPFTDHIAITGKADKIFITDAMGNVITDYNVKASGENLWLNGLQNFSKGIYFLTVITDNQPVSVVKMIK